MKIALLTYFGVCNFGANLQALSTVRYFQNLNINIELINWYPEDLKDYYRKCTTIEQQALHKSFVESYLPISRQLNNSDEISKYITNNKFDAILVGSDAVFSYIPIRNRIYLSRKTIIKYIKPTSDHIYPNPFLSLDCDIKKIALSASGQYLDLSKCLCFERNMLQKAFDKFDLLFVRDGWTASIIKNLCNKDVTITPDPVFAFNYNVPEFADINILSKYGINGKYIVCSFCKKLFNDNWFTLFRETANKRGYKLINLAMPEGCIDFNADIKIDTPISTRDWYNIIKYSNGYIGQRMHPMIVAMHNLVPFVIFDHYAFIKGENQLKSSKIYDLLKRAALLDYYFNANQVQKISSQNVIDLLLNFDKEKEKKFTYYFLKKYQIMMNMIINKIQN